MQSLGSEPAGAASHAGSQPDGSDAGDADDADTSVPVAWAVRTEPLQSPRKEVSVYIAAQSLVRPLPAITVELEARAIGPYTSSGNLPTNMRTLGPTLNRRHPWATRTAVAVSGPVLLTKKVLLRPCKGLAGVAIYVCFTIQSFGASWCNICSTHTFHILRRVIIEKPLAA